MTSLVYSTGTVSVSNASAVVTGTGTAWLLALVTGGMFSFAGMSVPILSVESDTSLTLAYAWPGTTAGGTYAIARETSEAVRAAWINDRLAQILTKLSLVGIHPDGAGTLAERDALSPVPAAGFIWLRVEVGFDLAFYKKTASGWDGPFAVKGEEGPAGTLNWKEAGWVTATAYAINDGLARGGSSYRCYSAHTSSAATEPGVGVDWATVWKVAAAKGDTGAAIGGLLTSRGDLAVQGASGAQRLALGIAGYVLKSDGADAVWAPSREVLPANRIMYVGFDMGTVSMSIASPAVVTKNAHGLVAGSRCSFSIKPNTKTCTISVASPAVVTMANTFAAGQPVVFSSTSRLPTGIMAGTTYYVLASGLSGSSFQIAATPGGSAINTSAPAVTISNASPGVVTETSHGLSVGDPVTFATTGALPTGLTAGTQYFVKLVPTGSTYQVSATPEGAAINTSSAGSGTHTRVQNGTQFCSETGMLPTGVTAGQDYYVIGTGLTANTFQFSATLGGSAVITTGSTSGTISCRTGSDSNDGLSGTAAGALLTWQKAWDALCALDLGGYSATIQVGDGAYITGINSTKGPIGGPVLINGNSTTPANVLLNTAAVGLFLRAPCVVTGQNFEIRGGCVRVTGGADFTVGAGMIFGLATEGHLRADIGGAIRGSTSYTVSGGAAYHLFSNGGLLQFSLLTVTISGAPNFTGAWANVQTPGLISTFSLTYSGLATGVRYAAALNGVVNTFGSGATALPGSASGTAVTGGQYA